MATIRKRYITDSKGRRIAVVVPLSEYEELLEDLHDLAIVAERRDEPVTSHTVLKRRLKADGLLSEIFSH